MLGKLNSNKKEAVIIGAGISGLLMGYRLKQLGYKIKIYEQSNRVGGLIKTLQTPLGPVEQAAHSLMISPPLLDFFNELRVPLQPVNANSRSRFIIRNRRFRKFPLNPIETFFAFFKALKRPQKQLNPSVASLKEWCENYLGSTAHDYLLSPFVTGVFACAPSELNAKLTFPKLFPDSNVSLISHFRSLKKLNPKKPRAQMMTPVYGMQSVVDALVSSLNEDITYNSEINTIPDSPNVILTVPAEPLSKLLQSVDPTSSELLKKLSYSPLITTTVFFNAQDFLGAPPRGVGVLIPRSEGYKTLGVLYNSSAFNHRTLQSNQVSLTFMFGGTQDPEALKLTDQEITSIIHDESKKLFNTKNKPHEVQITRWTKAIPIYSNLLKDVHDSLKSGFTRPEGRIIFNNFSGQVSIRGMIETLLELKQ